MIFYLAMDILAGLSKDERAIVLQCHFKETIVKEA
jgi:hypothetical protein